MFKCFIYLAFTPMDDLQSLVNLKCGFLGESGVLGGNPHNHMEFVLSPHRMG